MNLKIPKLSLVVLIGPSGSGKSTFAQKHFLKHEIISSDFCRGMISNDENDQTVTKEAFDLLHYIAGKRLALGNLTVVDATSVQKESREPLVQLARKYHCLPVAIVLNVPEKVCHERNRERADRDFGSHVVRNQRSQLKRSLRGLRREGFRHVFVLSCVEDIEAAKIERVPLWNDKRNERGPFDIIGDVHGCCDELEELLVELGYLKKTAPMEEKDSSIWGNEYYFHPEGRKAFFVGDLVDRGPRSLDVIRIARNMVHFGTGLFVLGNHDDKFKRYLWGKKVKIQHGLETTVAEIDELPENTRDFFCKATSDFIDAMVSHYVLDEGKLVVAHAGMKEAFQGRGSGRVREFALYGETTGETDEFGLPVRHNWASEYRGSAMVVYGHTPVPEPDWLNRTINIDTGCVFGGRLTAFRYPEKEIVSVDSKKIYCQPSRPFLESDERTQSLTAQQIQDDLLDAKDVIGKRIISTRLQRNVTIRAENSTAALEVMSRFAANPKWLIYLPPTMSPSETTDKADYLEHPEEAFSYFRNQGVPEVVCEEKHMGSRAVVVICRDADVARKRFGVTEGEIGIVYTRTGRRFFNDPDLESQFLNRLRDAMGAADFWQEFSTSWACLDCELMPWSTKAQSLLQSQYAAVGAAGSASLPAAVTSLQQAWLRLAGEDKGKIEDVLTSFESRKRTVEQFVTAYRQYCWPVETLSDLKLAPFHLLATEGRIHMEKNHKWHMKTLSNICKEDPKLLLATEFKVVDVTSVESQNEGVDWWISMTEKGGEGMVVKPSDWVVFGKKGLVQPAVKCRGKEYLRIIYGPDYNSEENLNRLRKRSLGRKRSLALREFALGIEGLERFIRKEQLRKVHECAFGVLALESEPVDPRL